MLKSLVNKEDVPYNRACGMLSLTIKSETPLDSSSAPPRIRKSVRVRGVVQGVGFRPFVYRLAMQNALGGHIGNDTDGVTIEIEGYELAIADFLHRLTSEAPPISRIDSVQVSDLAPIGETAFTIVHSQVLGQVSTGIPADAATCSDCLRELLDAHDRPHPRRFAFGVPTESVHWVTAAGIRPGVNSVILGDADAIARSSLRIAAERRRPLLLADDRVVHLTGRSA